MRLSLYKQKDDQLLEISISCKNLTQIRGTECNKV